MNCSKIIVMPRMLAVSTLAFLITGFTPVLLAEVAAESEVMSYLSAAADQDLPSHAMAGRGARVKIQSPGLNKDRLVFHLPDGTVRAARRSRTIRNGRITILGRQI